MENEINLLEHIIQIGEQLAKHYSQESLKEIDDNMTKLIQTLSQEENLPIDQVVYQLLEEEAREREDFALRNLLFVWCYLHKEELLREHGNYWKVIF